MRKQYSSDISKEQFEEIRLILESAKKKTKPRKVELYEVFCAVLYVLKSACQWRMLPSDFPKCKVCIHTLKYGKTKKKEKKVFWKKF